jgi:hypothetical protein
MTFEEKINDAEAIVLQIHQRLSLIEVKGVSVEQMYLVQVQLKNLHDMLGELRKPDGEKNE